MKSCSHQLFCGACVLALGAGLGAGLGAHAAAPQSTPPVDQAAFRAAVREARRAMDAGDFAACEKAYATALAHDPSSAEARFNQGVAQYRAGNRRGAAESFAVAAESTDAALSARSMFNQGDAVYSEALTQLEAPPSDAQTTTPQAAPDLKGAIDAVTTALTHYTDAAKADATDLDARVNAETATRLLKQLKELQKQQEQKQQEQKQEEQKQEEQKQEEQKQEDPKDEQQDEQQQKPQNQSGGEQNQKDDPQQNKQEPEQQQEQEPQGGNGDESKDESNAQDQESPKPSESKPEETKTDPAQSAEEDTKENAKEDATGSAGEPVETAPLTKEQAQRLLQAVRDREKMRRESQERAQVLRRTPTAKDW